MRRAVGAHNGLAALFINGTLNFLSHMERTCFHYAAVEELAGFVLLHVADTENCFIAHPDHTVVSHLTAHLRIKRSAIQYDHAFHATDHLVPQFAFCHHGQNPAGILHVVIAGKFGRRGIQPQVNACPGQIAQSFPGFPGTDALLFHELVERGLVYLHPLFFPHLDGQIDGEPKGVIKLERVGAGEGFLALLLVGREHLLIDPHAAVNGLGKVLLLGPDHLGDIPLLFPQIRIGALVLMHHSVYNLMQKGAVYPQELSVAGRPAQQTAQHIAPAFVGGQYAVADHHDSRADVVGNHPQGHVGLMALAIVGAGDLADLIGDIHHRVHVKEGVYILHHAGKTLQAHTGVDVLVLHLRVMALAVVDKLGKYVVPHLNIAVALAANRTTRLSAAMLRAAVIVNLRAGSAGTSAVLPEVILFSEPEDPVGGNSDVLIPDFKGLFIIQIDGRVKPVGFQTHHFGQKLPAIGNGFFLKIVSERKVAQHLKIGAMAVRLADVFNVAGADALLAGGHPVAGRLLLPGKPGFHGRHAGVDKQQAGVVVGNQGKAGQAQMAFAFKIAQEHLPQFIEPVIGMCHWYFLLYLKLFFFPYIKKSPRPGIGAKALLHGTTLSYSRQQRDISVV